MVVHYALLLARFKFQVNGSAGWADWTGLDAMWFGWLSWSGVFRVLVSLC